MWRLIAAARLLMVALIRTEPAGERGVPSKVAVSPLCRRCAIGVHPPSGQPHVKRQLRLGPRRLPVLSLLEQEESLVDDELLSLFRSAPLPPRWILNGYSGSYRASAAKLLNVDALDWEYFRRAIARVQLNDALEGDQTVGVDRGGHSRGRARTVTGRLDRQRTGVSRRAENSGHCSTSSAIAFNAVHRLLGGGRCTVRKSFRRDLKRNDVAITRRDDARAAIRFRSRESQSYRAYRRGHCRIRRCLRRRRDGRRRLRRRGGRCRLRR